MVFKGCFVHVDKKNGVYFDRFIGFIKYNLTLHYQVKRKQALLESNLPGIALMTDKNNKFKELLCGSLIFLEVLMPSKTHR